jgi:hypothetical protein
MSPLVYRHYHLQKWDGIAKSLSWLCCWMKDRVRFPIPRFHPSSGAWPVSCLIHTWGAFLAIKLPERGRDHSPSSTAEVKNVWAYTSTMHGQFSWLRSRAGLDMIKRGMLSLAQNRSQVTQSLNGGCEFYPLHSWSWPFEPSWNIEILI